jgi:2-polyprenyl-3-methyl-5-hydroxy-6-metoxy-1,4-benzoquinol methylase
VKNFKYTWEEAVLWLLENHPEIAEACYYDDPIKSVAERFAESEEWACVREVLSSKLPCRVLDVGAGRGISSYAFAKDGCEVYALEPNDSKLVGRGCISRLAQESDQKINLVSDLSELVADAIEFDVIYCRASLHHIPDLDSFFKSITSLLRKGGIFFASREHIIQDSVHLEIFLNHHALHNLYGGEHALKVEEYTKNMEAYGLKLTKVYHHFDTPINYYPESKESIRERILDFKSRSRWKFIPNLFLREGFVLHKKFMKSFHFVNYFPGMHCSFLAVKR